MAGAALLGRLTWRVGTVVALHDETATARTITLEIPDWPGYPQAQEQLGWNHKLLNVMDAGDGSALSLFLPGNVRQLQNFIERAVILTPGTVLQVQTDDLAEPFTSTMVTTLQAAVREHILRTLRETRGVIGGKHGAALRLGVKRTTLMCKLRKLGISHGKRISDRKGDEQTALPSKS